MTENVAATLSDFVAGAIEDTVKQLADPDADKNIIAYLRGALGAFLLVKAKLDADDAPVSEPHADESRTEAPT